MISDYHKDEIDFSILQNMHIKTEPLSFIIDTTCCKCSKLRGNRYVVLHKEHCLCYKCFESFIIYIGKIDELEKKAINISFGGWTFMSCKKLQARLYQFTK